MSGPRIGSLCSGYGGLDMAVQNVFGGDIAWFFEYDKAPSKILAHHWPEVPNYGDMTKADWAAIEQVDILCGGTPCQDLSGAGKRAGMTEGTRSNLWVQMREAIAIQRPSVVIWENVRGAYSARADSEVERTEGLLGADGKRPALRALGRVLGDLSSLGYDSRSLLVRASDAGAPHRRERVFVVAEDTNSAARDQWRITAPGQAAGGRSRSDLGGRSGTPTGDADDQGLEGRPLSSQRTGERATWPDGVAVDWRQFERAIERWERVGGLKAPVPMRPDGRGGNYRLSPDFEEWMMGLEPGHVTSPAIGLTRTEQMKALGNGVVPQQAEYAIRQLVHA